MPVPEAAPTVSARLNRRPWYVMPDRAIRFVLKPLVFAASCAPAGWLAWTALSHQLNANPFNAIVRSTGLWSLRFLCLTLALTPLRWLTEWHGAVKFRRMLGLFAFFYGTLHVAAYVVFDRVADVDAAGGARGTAMAADVLWAMGVEMWRPFFAIGWAAFLLLVPLALTSTAGMIRRLGGRRWRTVHRLVYAAAIGSVVHTYWPLRFRAERYVVILAVILTVRLARAYARRPRPLISRP